jgi:hypothetical protein
LAQACAVFNVTPSVELRQRDFVRRWHKVAAGRKVAPLFVPGFVARLGAWGVNLLKRVLGKPGKTDVRYALACATRDLRYSNAALGKAIGWQDLATRRYTTPAPD